MIFVVVVACILVAVCIALLVAGNATAPVIEQTGAAVQAQTNEYFGDTVFYEGTEYQRNPNITTILFLGVAPNEAEHDALTGGVGCAEVIVLLLLDEAEQRITLLQIPPDAMVSVDFYTAQEEYDGSATLQISMQYAASGSMRRSNWLMSNKISALLCGMPVEDTLSLRMEDIILLVDALEGVEITAPEDYTDINNLLVEAETLLLDGALDFEMESTLSAAIIQKLASYTLQETIYTPVGEYGAGAADEFYMEEDALADLVLALFYQQVSG